MDSKGRTQTENKELKRTCGPKKDELTEKWRKCDVSKLNMY
jgi:hypothetical protein